MPDWQERVTRESEPAIRAEHELRYSLAAPLVHGAALWCDLGCGSGAAATGAIAAGEPPSRVVLVDVAPHALEDARRELRIDGAVTLQADLADEAEVRRVRAELLEHAGDGARVVTCFETIEHLTSFAALVELLVELAEQHGFTVIASVPNDEFWSLENPHHHTVWGEGAFEELRSLLPDDHVVLHQLTLQGSAVAPAGADPEMRALQAEVDPTGVPSHFLIAMGPAREQVVGGTRVVQADLEDQRRWERERESDLVYTQAQYDHVRAEVQAMSKEFEDWRAYIHDLEGRLGLPLSGVERGEEPPTGSANGSSPEAPREDRLPAE
jgi:hypothetical protein